MNIAIRYWEHSAINMAKEWFTVTGPGAKE